MAKQGYQLFTTRGKSGAKTVGKLVATQKKAIEKANAFHEKHPDLTIAVVKVKKIHIIKPKK